MDTRDAAPARRASPPTTTRTAARRWRCATGWSTNRPDDAPWAEAVGGRGAATTPRRRRARARCARRSSRAASPARRAGWPASCSSTTGARRGPAWWWFFERRDQMTVEELVDDARVDRRPGAGRARPIADKKSLMHTLAFPPQQHKLGAGRQAGRPRDEEGRPARSSSSTTSRARWCFAAGRAARMSRCRGRSFRGGRYDTNEQRGALARLAASMLAGDGRYPALRDILARDAAPVRGRTLGGVVQTIDTRRAARAGRRARRRAISSSRARRAPARRGRARA